MGSEYIFSCKEDEKQWVIQIEEMIKGELDKSNNLSVPVYHVPKSLSVVKPEAYSPQLIALGPYHHLRPELYDMERYKLASAKIVQKQFNNLGFQRFVDELQKEEINIRACYHKYLNFSRETLAYIMAIDGLFLIDILSSTDPKKHMLHGAFETQVGKKLTKDAILRDIMMLENQIPFFVLKKIVNINCSREDVVDHLLPSMLRDFCEKNCPVIMVMKRFPLSKVLNYAHILDLMYHMVLPDESEYKECNSSSTNCEAQEQDNTSKSCFFKIGDPIDGLMNNLKLASNLNFGFMKKLKGYVELAMKVTPLLPHISDGSSGPDNEDVDGPLVESLKMPTVSFLHESGVKIKKAPDIRSIKFDVKKVTLYLPAIKLNVNSEVVLRNLVAYEAVAMSDSLVFSRYMELMNGIIDTEKDVELLVDKGVITSQVPYDEVARIFNGMSKSIGLTKAKNIDDSIEEVNKFYNGIPQVMVYKLTKRYVFASWKILTVLGSLLLLGLMVFQSFCSVNNCPKYFNTNAKMG